MHAHRNVQIGLREFDEALPSALEVADLDHFPAFLIPLTHQQSDPFVRIRMNEHGKTREISPFMLLLDLIFLLCVGRQF